ncbi:hypothetical protein [Streptomyces sp. NBC_01744]|uniref:hypothetical protein n=1 Tax=Streptomyces sp. NBC_01744 TaxID=2975927 RepID=UPI003D9A66EB|nr:hypothetical protein OIE70_36390 [Streptomyces sp. NBC_01744]
MVHGDALRQGRTTSCGCFHREQLGDRSRTHGQKGTPLYRVWVWMIGRCCNENNASYAYYGGRGITVCPEWRKSFEAFARDVGASFRDGLTIERVDNGGNYEPGNVRWATRQEQARNRRSSRLLTFEGETRTLTEWSERLGLRHQTLQQRLDRSGWTVERALTTPPRQPPRTGA